MERAAPDTRSGAGGSDGGGCAEEDEGESLLPSAMAEEGPVGGVACQATADGVPVATAQSADGERHGLWREEVRGRVQACRDAQLVL